MGETPLTTVNGPGERYLIHLRGCTLGCLECFNPESWSSKIKTLIKVKELADRILSTNRSLSISGGEPFQQAKSLLEFLKYIHKNDPQSCPFEKGVLIFSGYYEEELQNIPEYSEIIKYTDVIISGRYDKDKKVYDSMLSSSNQKFIFGPRGLIKEEELQSQDYEIIIEGDQLKLTGFPDLSKEIRHNLKELGIELKG